MQTRPNRQDVATLIELAITAEQATRDIYLGLADKFSHLPPVANFWRAMAEDESTHAEGLTKLRDSLMPEQLSAPADAQRDFVAAQLKKHIARLDQFPQLFRVLGNTPGDHP